MGEGSVNKSNELQTKINANGVKTAQGLTLSLLRHLIILTRHSGQQREGSGETKPGKKGKHSSLYLSLVISLIHLTYNSEDRDDGT